MSRTSPNLFQSPLNPLKYAYFLLGRRAFGEKELHDKLAKKCVEEREIKRILQRLLAEGYIDDEKFVRNFIEERIKEKPVGKFYLIAKLKEKKIAKSLIEKYIAILLPEERENSLAKEALLKKMQQLKNKKVSKEKLYQKLVLFLKNRGFTTQSIASALEKMKAKI